MPTLDISAETPERKPQASRVSRLSISARIFVAVLATSVLVVILTAAAADWNFRRGFVGYLNDQALQRLEDVLPRVQTAYADNGSWKFLRDDPERWFDITRPRSENGQAHRFVRGETLPPVSDLTGAFLRMSLLDADRQYILGLRTSSSVERPRIERPIVVNGLTVGWVVIEPFQTVAEVGARRFQSGQLHDLWLIGLAAIALAAAIAWWVSRAVLRPIRRVARATHELAGGDYSRRIPVTTRDEVGRLASDFNHLAGTLERNERLRRDFMADVSHELRTPLGVLNGELEAMEDGIRPFNVQALKSLKSEVSMLSKLVGDLHDLALADVAALAYRKADTDIAVLTLQAADSYADRFAQSSLDFKVEVPNGPALVHGDRQRLLQLLLNLLENSRRYTSAGGQVVLRLMRVETPKLTFIIELSDTSPGVDTQHLPRLFERFYRVEASRNRATGGSGLGLAICQRIVEAHNGRIEAAASPLGGLRIAIELPAA